MRVSVKMLILKWTQVIPSLLNHLIVIGMMTIEEDLMVVGYTSMSYLILMMFGSPNMIGHGLIQL